MTSTEQRGFARLIGWCLLLLALAGAAVCLAGPNMARYGAVRGSSTPADSGWTPDTNGMTLFMDGHTNLLNGTLDLSGWGNTGIVSGTTLTILGTNTDASANNFGRVKVGWFSDGIDDQITIPGTQSIQGGPNGFYLYTPLIATMWVKPSNQPAYGNLAYCGAWGANGVWALVTEATPAFYGGLAAESATTIATNNGANISLSAWTHLAAVYYYSNPAGGGFYNVSLYVNGTLIRRSANIVNATIQNGNPILIGAAALGGFTQTAQLLTDVCIFTNYPAATGDTNVDYAAITTLVSNRWYNTGGKYTNQPWMSNENGY